MHRQRFSMKPALRLHPERSVRHAPKKPILHTTPWTTFLYTNNYLRDSTPSCKDFIRILVVRPIRPAVLQHARRSIARAPAGKRPRRAVI